MNHWDKARILGLPGVQTAISIHPAAIPTRIKRRVQRMIKQGLIEGGWQSKARHIADMLDRQFNLGLMKNHGSYVRVTMLDRETRDRLLELHRADRAAYLLEHRRNAHMDNYFDSAEELLTSDFEIGYAYYHHPQFAQDARRIVVEFFMSDSHRVALREHVAARLDGTEIIPITITE